MTATVRERLLEAITGAVGGVYRMPSPEDERDLPLTFVQDSMDEGSSDYDFVNWITPVAVGRAELAVASEKELQRAQAHDVLGLLIRDMFVDEKFGGLAQGVDVVAQGIQTEMGKFVFAEASFLVRWRHVRGDPWATEVV